MYQYQEYFDIQKKNRPYTANGEELEDYLRLLDMLLESYLEYKGMRSRQKLFSRGLVVTESELTGYFDMPPYFRERDICDPILTASVQEAFSYIDNRTALTKKHKAYSELLRVNVMKEKFDLTNTELMAVLLALSVEIDRRYERIFGFLQDNISKSQPTLGLLYALMARITPREGSEETQPGVLDARMYRYFFLRKEEREGLNSDLLLQPLMRKLLLGIPDIGEIRTDIYYLYRENDGIPVFFENSAKEFSFIVSKENMDPAATSQEQSENRAERAVYLASEDEDAVLHLLYLYCSQNKEHLYVLDMAQLLTFPAERQQENLSELYLRMKMTNGRLAIRFLPEKDGDSKQNEAHKMRELRQLSDICKICSEKYLVIYGQKEEPGELASLRIPYLRIPDAPVRLRTAMWKYFLTVEPRIRIADDVSVPDLADCYEIPYGSIRRAIGHAISTALTKPEPVVDRDLILESLRQLNQVDFSGLATYVRLAYNWDDITLKDNQKELMKTACNRYRLRNRVGEGWGLKRKNTYGNGVSILLYGPPGTGKTMAAQVIANELALPLYRVDISQISSKYIGETEKNLALIFKAAAKANVILFFDEADALFTKRTDVSDSHDKYANSETAFLLQKIEEYDGMSILATNYYNNFDDAFVRRITYAVHLESPDKETRYTLWTSILPKTAELEEGIDFHFLANKFELSGSNIKSILFNAAYMAGAEQKPIGAKHIVRSLEYEFNKLGKLVNSNEFGDYAVYLQCYVPPQAPPKRPSRRRKITSEE